MTLEMRFARVIAAPVEEVFAALTAPAGQVAFYGQDDPARIVLPAAALIERCRAALQATPRCDATFGITPRAPSRRASARSTADTT